MKKWELLPLGFVLFIAAILIFVPSSSNDDLMQLKIERTKLEIKTLKLECKI